MKGKYFIDSIENIVYSTDSYSLYKLYNNLFFESIKENRIPIENPFSIRMEADRDSFCRAIEQEKQRYADGYVWKKGMWVKKERENDVS